MEQLSSFFGLFLFLSPPAIRASEMRSSSFCPKTLIYIDTLPETALVKLIAARPANNPRDTLYTVGQSGYFAKIAFDAERLWSSDLVHLMIFHITPYIIKKKRRIQTINAKDQGTKINQLCCRGIVKFK